MLKNGERLDDLHRDGLKIIQNPKGFCFGMDVVLLSAFAKVHKGQRALDLCCGNGIVPILLSAKSKGEHFTGLEIQERVADMAKRSVALNGLDGRVSIICGDLRDGGGLPLAGFDVVTCNPPYMAANDGKISPDPALAIARHELECNLDDIAKAAFRLLVPRGTFYMVHRPGRLADIFIAFNKRGLAPKLLRFVHSKAGSAPNLVLIMATKGGGAQLKVDAPLIIYGDDNQYTEEVRGMYYG
ncbi:MAG: tRNA1(Val) (adenine(37)-N6)-methyltransferase [Defluviitaleaceae bacterium]|nr:tRNA1(Val) (adenine(37)-N6)-methyltransferase [Defluviitaleaceae bacterium]